MIFSENRYPLFRIMLGKQKGSGTPAGALVQTSAPYGRGSREASRARLSAFHHGACGSDRTPPLNSSYALPGTWSERTTPMVRKTVRCSTGVTRSFLSQSSDMSRRPVIVPAGRIRRSRPRAKVTSPHPREPLSLRQPVSPAGVL